MASLFLNPPSSSSLSVFKKNPTSTTTFSRYPLLKNPNLSLFRSPKTNSRKLLKFSATNNNEEEKKEEALSFQKWKKMLAEMEKFVKKDGEEINSNSMVFLNESGKPVTEKEWNELLAELEEIDSNSMVFLNESRKPLTEKGWNELLAECGYRDNLLEKKFTEEEDRESKQTRDESSIEKLDMLIGPSAEREKELEKSESSSSTSKVPPLKEEDKELEVGFWDLWEELGVYVMDPTIENFENVTRMCRNKKKSGNPVIQLLDRDFLEGLSIQASLLEHKDIFSKCLNVNRMESCFEHDTFFITDVRRVQYIWTFTGFLKKPFEEVMPELEKKLSKATGIDVIVCFKEHEDDMTKKVCTVEPKVSSDYLLDYYNQSRFDDIPAIVFCIASFGTTALMSSFLLKPNATFDDYLANVVPLFGGLFSILGVSEIATRITAARYGVKLSPSFLIPSIWTGFLGVINDYESLLPNNKALFDIPVARTASAYLMSLVLVITAFVIDGSFNGGNNPMYISPEFFSYNTLLFYIQFVIGPYRDDFGNVLPYVVEGVGVPINPLAFAGILGFAVTSINLLPFRRMEGGRITQALFGHFVADLLNVCFKLFLLAIGVLDGNVLCLVWFLVSLPRCWDETPVKDEITPLGNERYTLGFILQVICVFTLFPNIAGRFSIFHFFVEIFNVISSSLSYNS